ncbi:MAG: chemotaxis protein CheA [Planctomycetota bacterium]
MSIEAFDPEILQDFLTESGELLDQLEGDLVALESQSDDIELINQVFRALHTIKGSASFLALTNLVEIAHAAESALNSARNSVVSIDQAMMDLLLRAVDVLRQQFDQLAGGDTDLVKADDDLVGLLTKLGEGVQVGADAGGTGEGPSSAGDPGDNPGDDPGGDGAVQSDDADDGSDADCGPGSADASHKLDLSPEKADLLDFFIADLDTQLAEVDELLAELASETEREQAAGKLTDVGGELRKTVEFFGHDPMLRLTDGLTAAAAAATTLEMEGLDALLPRVRAVVDALRTGTDGLREGVIIEGAHAQLVEEINAISRGEAMAAPAGDASGASPATTEATCQAISPATGPATSPAGDAAEAQAAAPSPAPETANAGANAPVKAAEKPKPERTQASAPEQTIRVEVGRLEALMNLVGELVLAKNRIVELAGRTGGEAAVDAETAEQFELASGGLERVTGDIQTAVMRTRMQPLDKLFGKYPRLIRDLSQKTGKKMRLVIEGGETEVDKSVIEELGDPLIHLMRNSADHGLEPVDERLGSGKDETGEIRLAAGQEGDCVRIQIIDDGRGLNRERIAKKAIERGLSSEAEVSALSDDEVARFIFLPGFSTADEVSDLSGRGVGMDVVRTNIEKLKGTIDVSSKPGLGSVFTIKIPLTVAIMPAMNVTIGDEIFAIPLGSIVEIVRPENEQLATIVKERVLRVRGGVLPLLDACEVFDVPAGRRVEGKLALVLSWGDREVGLLVTGVLGQQEIVIKPLEGIERSGPISGATVRNDGGVSLIIDVAELVRQGAMMAAA